jgi:hypothetical protein
MKKDKQIINAIVVDESDNELEEYPITEQEQLLILKYRNCSSYMKATIHRILDVDDETIE